MKMNQFGMLTEEEFANRFLGSLPLSQNIIRTHSQDNNQEVAVDRANDGADTIDWIKEGAVTAVKNQGQCGSCWAFGTVGGCEGLSKIADGVLVTFSEQQLVDCSSSYGNRGCNGGTFSNGYQYVKEHGKNFVI
eukprot:GHVR01027573.1.p1 GENE.GHVR01027573.1~~GHVR01027573.1.p1  ORF type:complete len:134 (-),score=18.96 GHVR01027573.1:3347-3748(-)